MRMVFKFIESRLLSLMRLSFMRWHALLALLLISQTWLPMQRATAKDDVDLKTIRAALDFYAATVTSIEGRYKTRRISRPVQKKKQSNVLSMEDIRSEYKFAVDLRKGRNYEAERSSFFYGALSKKRFEFRSITTFDGRRGWHLGYTLTRCPIPTKVPAEVPHNLHIVGRDNMDGHDLPEMFAGLRMRRFGGNLASLVRTGGGRLEGREKVNGVSCYRVSMERGVGVRVDVWLDPQRDFLPRKQVFTNVENGWLGKTSSPKYTWESLEFKQFPAGPKGLRWFPIRGRASGTEINIVELRLNPEFEDEKFRIDVSALPDGVRVMYDGPEPTTYTGDRRDLWKEIEKKVEAADEEMMKLMGVESTPTTVTPPTDEGALRTNPLAGKQWVLWVVGTASLLLIAVGLWLVRRAKRVSTDLQ